MASSDITHISNASRRMLVLEAATDNDLLRCWRHQECWDCLKEAGAPCSWCPTSSACIPNFGRLQVLAPIWNADICPWWAERWELRSSPLGCHVSTITFFTCVVSILATFTTIVLIAFAARAARWASQCWKTRQVGWWKNWTSYRPQWWRARISTSRNRQEDLPDLLT